MKVRIGVGPGADVAAEPERFADLIVAMERLGFDSLWLAEVLTQPTLDPLAGLAFAAGHVRKLKLGTTLVVPGRHPGRLAKELATIDRLSGGRLLLVFVPGQPDPVERAALGVDGQDRNGWIEEALPVLRRLWTEDDVEHHGPRFSFAGVTIRPRPLQNPLEVWLGGTAKSALDRNGRLGEGWLPSLCTPEEAAAGRATIERRRPRPLDRPGALRRQHRLRPRLAAAGAGGGDPAASAGRGPGDAHPARPAGPARDARALHRRRLLQVRGAAARTRPRLAGRARGAGRPRAPAPDLSRGTLRPAMKTPAAVYVEPGRPMVIDDLDLPEPGPTQVLVRQFATGVCHSQLHELHRPEPALPLVLGHESTGVVAAAGREVSHVREGDNVMVTWVPRNPSPSLPLPTPAAVTYKGQPINFGAPTYTGVFTWSRDTVADQQMVVKLEPGVATDVTSIIGCAVMTGAGAALNAAQVRPGNSVAIIGVGGVGLSIVQACANVSAYPIIVVDLADDKLEFAKKFGATVGVNASREDPVARIQELTGGGVDVAFDAIGVARTMEQVLQAARDRRPGERDGGVAVVVGVPHGEPPTPDMVMVFRGKIYRGAPGGCSTPDRDFPLLVRWFTEGKLPLDLLVTRRYRLDQINEACDALQRGEILGRAIVEF
jgi:Zn-dependent alcohol dehydrogenase/alkanesulfonate monooxygenase SsuD/methylene tetrahydromethanopterin reductase-like flavin-dependent oxidoreductase (luciferase family)